MYSPASFVAVRDVTFVSVSVKITEAPATTALDWSRTVPRTALVLACGQHGGINEAKHASIEMVRKFQDIVYPKQIICAGKAGEKRRLPAKINPSETESWDILLLPGCQGIDPGHGGCSCERFDFSVRF
jgi:hypothetical protein